MPRSRIQPTSNECTPPRPALVAWHPRSHTHNQNRTQVRSKSQRHSHARAAPMLYEKNKPPSNQKFHNMGLNLTTMSFIIGSSLPSLSLYLSLSLLLNIWLAERDNRGRRWQQTRHTLCLSQPPICVARKSVYAEAHCELNNAAQCSPMQRVRWPRNFGIDANRTDYSRPG